MTLVYNIMWIYEHALHLCFETFLEYQQTMKLEVYHSLTLDHEKGSIGPLKRDGF